MGRIWFILCGLVLVVGAIHTAFEYGHMVATEEYNSAPSSVALVYLIPYGFVSLILLVVGLLVARKGRSH